MANPIRPVCGNEARYVLLSDALECMAALCYEGEDVYIKQDDKGIRAYKIVVKESRWSRFLRKLGIRN